MHLFIMTRSRRELAMAALLLCVVRGPSRVECLASYLGYLGSIPRISYSRHNDGLQICASFASLDHGFYIMPLISYLASVSKFWALNSHLASYLVSISKFGT